MIPSLLTYTELAIALGFAPGTIKNIWRSLPFIPVTPRACEHPNLRGVRFDLDEVLNHLKQRTRRGVQHGYQIRQERQLPGLLQVPGKALQQDGEDQSRRQRMGSSAKESTQAGGKPGPDFDVFRRVRAVS